VDQLLSTKRENEDLITNISK